MMARIRYSQEIKEQALYDLPSEQAFYDLLPDRWQKQS